MLILDEIQGEKLVGARAEIGTRWPLYATSSGKALLAQMTDQELNLYVSEPRKQLTKKTLTSEADLRADLSAGKERGFWVSEEELQGAFSAVSTTISRPDGVVLGTVSLGGPANRLNRTRLFALGRMLLEEVDKL
jgi:DNA-binding IclR family transcriptional regulator